VNEESYFRKYRVVEAFPMRLLAQDDYDTYIDDEEIHKNQAFQFVVFFLYEIFLIVIFLTIDYFRIFDKPAKTLGIYLLAPLLLRYHSCYC